MKGQRIPHEQSAETSPRDREGDRLDRRLHVTGEHIHRLRLMWQSRPHWMRQQEWYRGIYSPSLTDHFSGSVRDGLFYIATLSLTDATAAHMPEKRKPKTERMF